MELDPSVAQRLVEEAAALNKMPGNPTQTAKIL